LCLCCFRCLFRIFRSPIQYSVQPIIQMMMIMGRRTMIFVRLHLCINLLINFYTPKKVGACHLYVFRPKKGLVEEDKHYSATLWALEAVHSSNVCCLFSADQWEFRIDAFADFFCNNAILYVVSLFFVSTFTTL